ncbi:MAG TPA: hypothetical protein ENN20_05140 [Candidatus Marinimicrobia bacterium]|mgnify:CR=1 FL=1|nr:hypothetical protein [Candidatus Neomarinimicrobiota bacterium]
MNSRENSTNDDRPCGTVTQIAFQKKRAQRRSVFIDGEYAFGVSEATFQQFHLQPGQVLSARQIEIIKSHEEFERAKELALKYLALRMRSDFELKSYLKRKGFPAVVVRRVLFYCHELRYLDDRKYAEMLVRDMCHINRYGRYKMVAQLRKRGISPEIIRQVLSELIDESEQKRIALKLATKKLASLQNDEKSREKLYRYLKQRGFSYSVISDAVNRLLKS